MQTLITHLIARAEERPDALYSRYIFADREPVETNFRDAVVRTREFAGLYARLGVTKGDVVLVVLDHHEDLMPAFLGAIWLGAVPSFLPALTAKLDPGRYHENLTGLMGSTRPRAIVCDAALRDTLEQKLPAANRPLLLAREQAAPDGIYGDPVASDAEDIALIQYSSGSTGLQKGAALSHRAVLAEMTGVADFFEMTDADSFLTWVPLYHDWGLVCVALHAIVLGTSYTLMAPMHWVTQPVTAFEAVDRYRPTVYYHPNFAFNFMAQRITDAQMEGIDLSSIRLCCNGAEPCLYDSHQMFAERFAKWGLSPDCLGIVYGMAEVTNSVFAAGHKEPIQIDCIDRDVLQQEHRAEPVADGHPRALRMLGVGRALTDTEFRLLDDERREVPERHVGEVCIRSRAAYHGYYNNPEATTRADFGGWYVSGDLGYRVGDILFITGRKSDLIIVGGVNIYPHDVEAIVAEHAAVVTGRVAAIGADDGERGTQKLVVIAESRTTDAEVLKDIARHVRVEVPVRLGIAVDELHHAPYRWLIKTSSGKIARIPNYSRLPELTKANEKE